MADAIVADRLTKYFGANRVVHSVSFRVPEGCVYALLGRNGAGKSTTIRMLTGMLQPDFGTATLLGEDVSELSGETRQKIAWVGEGHPLYRWMRVSDAVNFVRPFYREWKSDLVEQILDHFEIPLKRRLFQLSYGQRAQVSLALAVAPDPKLLILDDPTLGLDTVVRRDFLESMIQIIQKAGRTILFSSHILSDVDRVADRVGIIQDGVLRVNCSLDQFRESIRKVVVELNDDESEPPSFPGSVSSRRIRNRLGLVVVGYGEQQQAMIEELSPRSIEVLNLNLEDAFVEYTRGRKGALPVFQQETVHV